jgi:hypothetical protein
MTKLFSLWQGNAFDANSEPDPNPSWLKLIWHAPEISFPSTPACLRYRYFRSILNVDSKFGCSVFGLLYDLWPLAVAD